MQELNEITLYDWIMLKILIEITFEPTYQCGICVTKMSESFREQKRGCTGKYERKFDLGNGVYLSRCPGNYYNPGYAKLLELHSLFKRDVMANHGSYLDQPSKYLEAMNLISSLISQKQSRVMEKPKNGR